MSGFLERWAENARETGTQPPERSEESTTGEDTLNASSGNAISWADWKASELNQLFQKQGVTGKPGRIKGETVRSQMLTERGAKEKPNRNKPITVSDHGSAGQDPLVTEARREIAGLLAAAHGRDVAVRRVGADRTEDSCEEQLANSRAKSVHGVVE